MRRPSGLKSPGGRLWKSIVDGLPDGWELDEREVELLTLAARQADTVAALEAIVKRDGLTAEGSTGQPVVHPAVIEARQGRLAVDRLLGKITLPSPEKAEGETAGSLKGRAAANTRWATEARREARRGAA